MSTSTISASNPTEPRSVGTNGVSVVTLSRSYEACRRITRREARNFYWGLRLTPEPKRSALCAVYAWMRRVDDIVDAGNVSLESRRALLDEFRRHTRVALHEFGNSFDVSDSVPMTPSLDASASRATGEGGRPRPSGGPFDESVSHHSHADNSDHAIESFWPAIADTVRRYNLDPSHFAHMIDGQAMDLESPAFRTFDDLHLYCRRVAGTVAQICVSIWGAASSSPLPLREGAGEGLDSQMTPASALPSLAELRGVAFQLTNILRDFAGDFTTGRSYLPADELAQFKLDTPSLLAWRHPDRCKNFIRYQTDRAASCFDRSAALDALVDPAGRATLWTMTRIYRELLDRIAAHPRLVVSPSPVRLAAARKTWIALQGAWRSRIASAVTLLPSASSLTTTP